MFEGFEQTRIKTRGATINLVYGGQGPPALLLHGYPQTHAMWHRVAPAMAERFTVVVPDLRGYGDSSKPPAGDDHSGYSKRALAADGVEVMEALGFGRFAVVGHDRGARVGHRMALDYPEKVTKLAALDIVPTHKVFGSADKDLAIAYYHWFFLSQPYDLPETLIGADPTYYLRKKLGHWGTGLEKFASEALAEYERCFSDPATIHASCEDYRAAATIDLVHDETDFGNHKISCPLLLLWGGRGAMERLYDVPEAWRDYAEDIRGRPVDAGHFLAEEKPEEVSEEILAFLES